MSKWEIARRSGPPGQIGSEAGRIVDSVWESNFSFLEPYKY